MTVKGIAAADLLLRLLRTRILRARRKATSDALAPWVRAVDATIACGAQPGRKHWEDCFRRSCDYMLAHTPSRGACPPIASMRLVHGVCRDGSDQWAHAWVELPGGLVFDGVRQEFYDRDGYCRVLGAVAEARYDASAMIEKMVESEKYGPWHSGTLGRDATRRLVGTATAGGVVLALPAA